LRSLKTVSLSLLAGKRFVPFFPGGIFSRDSFFLSGASRRSPAAGSLSRNLLPSRTVLFEGRFRGTFPFLANRKFNLYKWRKLVRAGALLK